MNRKQRSRKQKSRKQRSRKQRSRKQRRSRNYKIDGMNWKLILPLYVVTNYIKEVAAKMEFLSGPVGIDVYTNDNGNIYIYLKDIHHSTSGLCRSRKTDEFSIYNFLLGLGEITKNHAKGEPVEFFSEHEIDHSTYSHDILLPLGIDSSLFPLGEIRKKADICYRLKDTETNNLCGNVNFHAVDPRFIEDLADYDNTVKSIIATGIVSDEFINEYSNVFFSKDLFKNMPEDAYIKKYINKLPKYYKKKFIDIASEYYNYLRTVVLPTMSRDSLYTRILILTTGSVELIALAEALFKDSPISVFYFGKIHSDNAEYLLTKILPKYLDLNFEKVLSINPEYHKERCLDIKKLDKFLPKETVRVPEAIIRGDLSGLPPNLNYTKK